MSAFRLAQIPPLFKNKQTFPSSLCPFTDSLLDPSFSFPQLCNLALAPSVPLNFFLSKVLTTCSLLNLKLFHYYFLTNSKKTVTNSYYYFQQ